MKTRHIVILTVCIFCAGYCLYALQSTVTPYVSIAEAKRQAGNVQVKGMLDASRSESYRDGKFHFYLKDEDGGAVEVVYRGMKPDGFDDAVHVVAVGKYEAQAIQADRLLIKCPSKYEGRRP